MDFLKEVLILLSTFQSYLTKQLDDLVSYALKYLQALHSKNFDVTLEQLQHLLLINTYEHIAWVLFLMNINTNASLKWLYKLWKVNSVFFYFQMYKVHVVSF